MITQENFVGAEALFRSFLEQDPDCGEGRCYLGLALRSQGRMGEALVEFQLAAKLAPDNPKPPLQLGVVLNLMGRRADARPWLEKAVASQPYSADPLIAIGYLEELDGRLPQALARYDQALALDNQTAAGHLFRGALLRKMGREKDADAALKRAAELVPRNALPLQRFARQLAEMGHADLAQPLFEMLVQTSPEVAAGHAGLANCYLLAGENARAVNEYVAAVRLAPEEAQYHYLLGCAYGGLGDYAGARAAWERTLQLKPTHVQARQNLELLNSGSLGKSR
jgi:tetratricopeptide (TPR) repeat protein